MEIVGTVIRLVDGPMSLVRVVVAILVAGLLTSIILRLAAKSKRHGSRVQAGWALAVLFIAFLLLLEFGVGPINYRNRAARESGAMQTCRTIALAEFQYANDNQGRYPGGKSSTEVFQKLLDGNYVSEPALFFVPLPGKVAPTGRKLKPENVAFDVTSGVDANSPDTVPLVFLTGFRVDYRPNGAAVSLIKPFPKTTSIFHWSSLLPWARNESSTLFDGLPIVYHSNNAWFRTACAGGHPIQYTPDGYGIVPHVIASDFDAHGKTYRQLTPEGPPK
jgi:hypothetical protein